MSLARLLVAVALSAMFAVPAHAQLAQTIQLPTFAFTTVATTVSVPDRGSVTLGGIGRSRTGRNQVGTPFVSRLPVLGRPFNNVGIGGETEALNQSITAYIHDFDSMDEALLAEAAARRGGQPLIADAPQQQMIGLNPAALSIAEIRRRQATAAAVGDARPQLGAPVEDTARQSELADLLARAREAEAKGKPKVAKIFYRMISRDTTGQLKQFALTKLDALSRPSETRLAASPSKQ